jgi:hypothetical protein
MVMVDPNGILLCENRKAAGGCWLMALIRHIEEACDISRKLAMSASKAKRTNYGKSVSHTKLRRSCAARHRRSCRRRAR